MNCTRLLEKSVMTETLKCLINWIFGEFGLNRAQACPLQHNLACGKLLEKVGFFKKKGPLWRECIFKVGSKINITTGCQKAGGTEKRPADCFSSAM